MAKANKKKFDWNYFLDKSEKKVVHCETKKEAEQFCRLMHEHGLRWCGGMPYVKTDGTVNTQWTGMSPWHNEVLNCYSNQGAHDALKFYNEVGIPILRFSAYDFSE